MGEREMTLGEEIINLVAKGVDVSTVERMYRKYIKIQESSKSEPENEILDQLYREKTGISYRSYKQRNKPNYNTITFNTREYAEKTLRTLNKLIAACGVVSIADYCDLVGISTEYTDDKYGWTNIDDAIVYRAAEGYKIKLPKTCPVKRYNYRF